MALTQGARRKIQTFVQSAKALLIREFASQLQQHYGIRPDGSYMMVEELTTHDAAIIQTARLLRERLNYLEGTIAGENKAEEAVEQLVREQAFTILNRFAALRMAEERKIIPEAIKRGYQSEGFQVFDQLTGGAKTAEVFERYTWFLKANFDELAIDLPAVFDRFSPYALLFPSEKVLLELLKIIDDEDLSIYREEGQQPMNLWSEDETIGWVYQYYNSREEIKTMRDASGSPRNSRELAVRNQFFTPRYVVQFLVDNSLGRQWFEMTHGQTKLVDSCQYMVKRENEIFLAKGKTVPEAKIEGANYIEHRALKDPRAILMLDPACGSMHFGLYCFDLFEQIYIEAWDHHPELMPDLRDKYIRKDFLNQIPKLILEYNIHGVDIDPRAIQIAGLSLWLRVQKSYNELGLLPVDRPIITKSNLVVAEPMPGDVDILSDFTRSLAGPIGKLVRVIWEKMQFAGETGMLLKIEEELKREIEIAKEEYKKYKNTSAQTTFFDAPKDSKAAEMAAIYGKDQKITKDFFDTAEEEVVIALKNFAENAQGENAFQKLLFAEDTARGFAFIELCRKRYDVIVMNPPFGAGSISTEQYYKTSYPNWGKNILCCFFSRMNSLLSEKGDVGAIFDRTVSVKSSYEKFRVENFIGKIKYVIDTGWNVLDANVETTVYVISNSEFLNSLFVDLRDLDNKNLELLSEITNQNYIIHNSCDFQSLPNSVIGYYFEDSVIKLFNSKKNIRQLGLQARDGHNLDSFEHFRLFWEIKTTKTKFSMMYNGGPFSMFYYPYRDMCLYGDSGELIRNHRKTNFRNPDYQQKIGVGYGKRGDYFDAHILKEDTVFTKEGQAISNIQENEAIVLLSFLNSSTVQYLLSLYSGQHKASGYVNLLPLPGMKPFEGINELIQLKRESFELDETCLETKLIVSSLSRDFNSQVLEKFVDGVSIKNKRYEKLVEANDEYWKSKSNLSYAAKSKVEKFKDGRPNEFLYSIGKTNFNSSAYINKIAEEVVMNFVGFVFKRWDINMFKAENFIEPLNNIFTELNRVPRIKSIGEKIEFIEDLSRGISSLIIELWSNESLQYLEKLLGNHDLSEYVNNSFFNFHYSRYTMSRREAPIYWPLSTHSNSYIVWIYYPALNENTLFSIVNDMVEPKLEDVKEQIAALETTGDSKKLHEKMAFRDELLDFKKELLRVAQLPYKPNQDDGVLVTAAPLHNLFTHNKWHKSTEACWKKLEKGEYDWAHLAYGIWPERVTKKCKKDLSMAIAHGLESICEVKPKVTKKKEKKGVKIDKQGKLI